MADLSTWFVAAACLLLAGAALAAGRGAVLGLAERRRDHEAAETRRRTLEASIARLTSSREAERIRALESWSQFRRFVVRETADEASDVRSFYLAPLDGRPLPAYRAGQHVTLQLTPPGARRPVVRCYTLSRAPGDATAYRISVRRALPPETVPQAPPGVMSGHLFEALHPGTVVDVKAPGGTFVTPPPDDRPLVLVAGGIGITPLLAMAEDVVARGIVRPVRLFYGVRCRDQMAFADRLAALVRAAPDLRVVTAFSRPEPGDTGHDVTGRLDATTVLERVGTTDAVFCLCGPPDMMEVMREGLVAAGAAPSDILSEAFGAAGARRRAPVEGHFQVRFARSGFTATWRPEAGTLLDLAEAEGVPLDSGCRAGQCGTCALSVLGGEIEHLGSVESATGGRCLACLAVPKADLVVDA